MRLIKGLGRTFLVAAVMAIVGVAARAQGAPEAVTVAPMARSAGFEIRLDKIAPALYSSTDPGPWMEVGRRAMLEWRPSGESRWRTAQDFVRIQSDRVVRKAVPDPRMATMLFGLEEGHAYDYRISFVGDGYPSDPITGSFTTLTTDVPRGRAQVVPIVVSSKTTSDDLYAALTKALSTSTGDNGGKIIEIRSAAGPGVRTVVRASLASIYGKGAWNADGKPNAWLTLRTAAGHNVVFDGSDAAYDVANQGMWSLVDDPGHGISPSEKIYISRTSVARPANVYYEKSVDSPGYHLLDLTEGQTWADNDEGIGSTGITLAHPGNIVSATQDAGSDTLVIKTDRLTWLQPGDKVSLSGSPTAAWNGQMTVVHTGRDDKAGVFEVRVTAPVSKSALSAAGGVIAPVRPSSSLKDRAALGGEAYVWVPDAAGAATGRLYIHLNEDKDPNSLHFKIPVIASCLDLTSSHYVVVEDMNIQYFGTDSIDGFGGIGLTDVSDVVIQNNNLTGLSGYVGNRTSFASLKTRVIVKGNTVRERGLGADPDGGPTPHWGWLKRSRQERIAFFLNGRAMSILDNHVEGTFNGFAFIGGGLDQYRADEIYYPENYEIDGNTFVGIGDDSVEPEQVFVNLAITNNEFQKCYKGISMAPLIGGPVFVLRNRWIGRGEYGASSDTQSFLKVGNDDPGDPAHKLIANNTVINSNVDPKGTVLVGLADSGATYNHFYFNNYIASDWYPVDFGYGSLGYPHEFDYNRYVCARPYDNTGRGSYNKEGWAIGRRTPTQGDPITDTDKRVFQTFEDWQTGKAQYGTNMPGYDGAVHGAPVNAPGTDGQTLHWLHDPHSSYQVGTQEMVDPANGDFRPRPDAPVGGAGVRLANITFDCGPGWARYEEAGNPTVGALPGGLAVRPGNRPPSVNISGIMVGAAKRIVSLSIGYSDPDGDAVTLVPVVRDSMSNTVPVQLKDTGAGVAALQFTPASEGIYSVTVNAVDVNGGKDSASATVSVGPEIPDGQDVLVQTTVSSTNAKPGEPVVYTIYCTNPTATPLANAQLQLAVPKGMSFFLPSAALDGTPVEAKLTDGMFEVTLGTVPAGVRRTVTVTATIQ